MYDKVILINSVIAAIDRFSRDSNKKEMQFVLCPEDFPMAEVKALTLETPINVT